VVPGQRQRDAPRPAQHGARVARVGDGELVAPDQSRDGGAARRGPDIASSEGRVVLGSGGVVREAGGGSAVASAEEAGEASSGAGEGERSLVVVVVVVVLFGLVVVF
jgi:hypothetical protein